MDVGTHADADLVATWHYWDELLTPEQVAMSPARIGRGEARTVYQVGQTVYKIGTHRANEWEHHMLTAWRAAGAAWAPPTTMYEVDLPDRIASVLAMPYIPDDGGEPGSEQLAEIRRAAPQVYVRDNVRVHGGQAWLIDGGDVEREP